MNKRLTLALLTGTLLALPLLGLGCKGGSQAAQEQAAVRVYLNWWTVDTNAGGANAVIAQHHALHPNTTVALRYIKPEDFEQRLLEALAAGQGPDIVSLPNTYLKAWSDRLVPLPTTITLPYLEVAGLIKKEPRWTLKTTPTLMLTDIRDLFVDLVIQDGVIGGKLYGLPLSLDTLILYYNRDLLNSSGVALPPKTWTEFKAIVQQLTKLDQRGHLLQNGVALGTADNVPYAFDILSALMLQNSTPMTDPSGTQPTFHKEVTSAGTIYAPGADALRFYTDFANPAKETYSWSAEEPSALQAFTSGKLGFYFAYWRDRTRLQALAPRLNLGFTTFPQIEGSFKPTYYANYYLEAVTKQSKFPAEAWDFVQFATAGRATEAYLSLAKVPTARRSLIKTQQDDVELAIPVQQVLAAKSWYRGYKPALAENIFRTLIRQVLGGSGLTESLAFAATQIGQTFIPPRY